MRSLRTLLPAATVVAALAAGHSGLAGDSTITAGPSQCGSARGRVLDGWAEAWVCNGASTAATTTGDIGAGASSYGCISIWFDDESELSGCGDTAPTALVADPVLGTAVMTFDVAADDESGVVLSATVTLGPAGPPGAETYFGHGNPGSQTYARAGAGITQLCATGPGSAITSSDGRGGEMEIGSDGDVITRADVAATPL